MKKETIMKERKGDIFQIKKIQFHNKITCTVYNINNNSSSSDNNNNTWNFKLNQVSASHTLIALSNDALSAHIEESD